VRRDAHRRSRVTDAAVRAILPFHMQSRAAVSSKAVGEWGSTKTVLPSFSQCVIEIIEPTRFDVEDSTNGQPGIGLSQCYGR
jgi:hypothetical protein